MRVSKSRGSTHIEQKLQHSIVSLPATENSSTAIGVRLHTLSRDADVTDDTL